MQIFLGADHRGFQLKQDIKSLLEQLSTINITDCGANQFDAEDDFNDYAKAVAKGVLSTPQDPANPCMGILICGSAQGVCMQANRFKGIRAAICTNPSDAELTRQHNDANILCLSANSYDHDDPTAIQDYLLIIKEFIGTEASTEERYQRRNKKLDED